MFKICSPFVVSWRFVHPIFFISSPWLGSPFVHHNLSQQPPWVSTTVVLRLTFLASILRSRANLAVEEPRTISQGNEPPLFLLLQDIEPITRCDSCEPTSLEIDQLVWTNMWLFVVKEVSSHLRGGNFRFKSFVALLSALLVAQWHAETSGLLLISTMSVCARSGLLVGYFPL